jgi:hypothetical protein
MYSYCYTAYGLGIRSELPLPDLVAVENVFADITIRLRTLDSLERQTSQTITSCIGKAEGVGTFLIRDGKEIIVEPAVGVEDALLHTALLGPGMAVLLRQRSLAVLHASGIVVNNSVVAFLGGSGWGKSTLAEAFYKRGYGVVTDDLMAIRLDGSSPQVIPGYPLIKLLPDAAVFLGCESSATHKVHSQTEKYAYNVSWRFSQGPLPLRRMYVLGVGECNKIESLQSQEAFVELVRNSRAVSLLKDSDSRNGHLHQCACLVTEVPICRLKRRPALADLPEVIRLIEEDFAKNSPA